MKKRTILILLILTLSIYALNVNVQITAEENSYRPNSLELTPHDPIEIISDSDFEFFPGTGTEEGPYLIEGYNISTTAFSGIYIAYTTKHFVIRNCYVDAEVCGIYIDDVADGTAIVINNTCSNNVAGYGIYLWGSGSSTVANNTCSNNDQGILLDYSDNSTVTNNTCNNNYHGIYLGDSGSSTVANNTCNNHNGDGIRLSSSGSSTVANNTCSNNNANGIWLGNSGSSTVANNTFTNCGLYIDEDTIDAYISYNTVENNWVNGEIIGFYINLDSTIIAEPVYGQLILVNCTNVTVRDQILNNATIGLFLYSCTYSVIINNTCSNNWDGIYLSSSVSSTVTNSTCNNNVHGIRLWYSVSSTVINNTCNNNTCNNNNNHGIWLWFSDSSIVVNNTCNYNNNGYGNGIYLSYSVSCVVTYNLLQENEGYGIFLEYGSDNNLIHHNTFVDNFLVGTSQARDDGANNYWYDTETLEGNYWSDWSGEGSYSIDSAANSIDLYPLDELVEYYTDETQIYFIFTLLMLVFPLLLARIISKKTKK